MKKFLLFIVSFALIILSIQMVVQSKDYTNFQSLELTKGKLLKDYKTSVNIWMCECDCGNIINVRQGDLLREHTCSCGCLQRSRGEITIATYLNQWNIRYIEQYRFDITITKAFNVF